MFGNSIFNINLIAKQCEYQKGCLGQGFFMINSAQKNLHRSVQWTSLDAAINSRIPFVSQYVTMTAVTSNFIRL